MIAFGGWDIIAQTKAGYDAIRLQEPTLDAVAAAGHPR